MKRSVTEREYGIAIPGITDEVLKRLPPPYDLIAEWSQYVPLSQLLNIFWATLALRADNDDGTVTLQWLGVPHVDEEYVIPLDLYARTNRYVDRTFEYRLLLIRCGVLRESPIFISARGKIGEGEFAQAVLACSLR